MGFKNMIYVKCTKCNNSWNVSVKADLSNYVCPVCRCKTKAHKKPKRKTKVKKSVSFEKGVERSVLLRNRKKFQSQR